MKKIVHSFVVVAALAATLAACKKEAKELPQEDVSPAVIAQIKSLGFNTDKVQKIAEGYLVEGDIILTSENLSDAPQSPELIYANEEHYRTNNVVNTSTYATIKVALSNSSSQHQAAFSAAVDEAIRRYNAEGLRIRFQRVTSGANITIQSYYQVSNTLGSAGFPTKSGAPYSKIQMNTYWYGTSTSSTNINSIASTMAHEMGHCVGFRHTDYMNRAYSCGGSAANEGTAGVGAVYIPGTPTGPSSRSWMLACTDGSNTPFTSADRTALNYLY